MFLKGLEYPSIHGPKGDSLEYSSTHGSVNNAFFRNDFECRKLGKFSLIFFCAVASISWHVSCLSVHSTSSPSAPSYPNVSDPVEMLQG